VTFPGNVYDRSHSPSASVSFARMQLIVKTFSSVLFYSLSWPCLALVLSVKPSGSSFVAWNSLRYSCQVCWAELSAVFLVFSSLTLCVGRQEEHPACRYWVMRCWRGYLSAARCKWFAYCSADATATPSIPASLKSRLVWSFFKPVYPDCPGKEAVKRMSVCLGS